MCDRVISVKEDIQSIVDVHKYVSCAVDVKDANQVEEATLPVMMGWINRFSTGNREGHGGSRKHGTGVEWSGGGHFGA